MKKILKKEKEEKKRDGKVVFAKKMTIIRERLDRNGNIISSETVEQK